MALQLVSGIATHLATGTSVSYAATSNGPMAIQDQMFSFRINGRPISYRTRSFPSLSEGDVVGAAGKEKGGVLNAYGIRNFTTGVIYSPPTTVPIILCVLLMIIGVALLFIFIGVFFIAFGVFVLLRVLNVRKAAKMLAAAPVPSTPAVAAS
jgi:hypothetical protein